MLYETPASYYCYNKLLCFEGKMTEKSQSVVLSCEKQGRKVWETPRVILSEIEGTRAGTHSPAAESTSAGAPTHYFIS